MVNFVDQHEIMFTQAMIATPMPGWEIIYDKPEDDSTRRAVRIKHTASKHEWALGEYDETSIAYKGLRVV
jgi:hypothetical protein